MAHLYMTSRVATGSQYRLQLILEKYDVRTSTRKPTQRWHTSKEWFKTLSDTIFPVLNGINYIRMVYDGTASGFNNAIYIPDFGLPTISSLLRGTSPTTWMIGLDVGDMFLKFMLHEEARSYVGIDVSKFLPHPTNPKANTF